MTNKEQKKIIDSIYGIYLVDAGAGTGKTYTITKRYLNILEKNSKNQKNQKNQEIEKKINPSDILLVTFTRNASLNMKEKVISKANPEISKDLLNAPIMSFDSFASRIVSKNGLNSPQILGINDQLSNYKLVSETVILKKIFKKFYNQFLEENEKNFEALLITLPDSNEILFLIEKLLSRGIYPNKESWFLDGENKIYGNLEEYLSFLKTVNISQEGKKGKIISSEILSKFDSRIKSKEFVNIPENYFTENLELNEETAILAFKEDRDILLKFIHDVYFEYIKFMIAENNMTFSLISMFAFLIMYNDEKVREQNSFEFVMVDEFQDTNEIQFMIMLLAMKTNNLCVVGDWKQGIYGFRNAQISNITDFENKIKKYKEILNKDKIRINFEVDNVEFVPFIINYRSSQKILEFSENSLILKAKKNENIDEELIKEKITQLQANFDYDETSELEFFLTSSKEEEIDFVLSHIQYLIKNKEIKLFDDEKQEYYKRKIKFSDIAILSRTRIFALKLLNRAREINIPAQYDGGIELFEEEEAIILLAWLRLILNVNKREAWIPILEKENYTYPEIRYILENKEYPENLLNFREHLLKNRKVITYIIDEIFNRYSFNSNIGNSILNIVDNLFHSTLMSLSDLINFIEDNIANKENYSIELESNSDSIKIQTIHASKGLEYPIVFIVNMNLKSFPILSPSYERILFNEMIGIRNKKEYLSEYKYIFDNWKTDLLSQFQFSDLDEERRLLYVAITRAMSSIYFTASNPSEFFNDLSNNKFTIIEEIDLKKEENLKDILVDEIEIKSKINEKNRIYSVHDFMEFKENEENEENEENQLGRGIEFGKKLHNLIFRKIENLNISKISKEYENDFNNVSKFIEKELNSAELLSEIDCSLPFQNILIRGVIDLIAIFEDRIEIIDWKTDLNKNNIEEYKKQLSIYYYVLKEIYLEKKIETFVFWTYKGEKEKIEVLDIELIINRV